MSASIVQLHPESEASELNSKTSIESAQSQERHHSEATSAGEYPTNDAGLSRSGELAGARYAKTSSGAGQGSSGGGDWLDGDLDEDSNVKPS